MIDREKAATLRRLADFCEWMEVYAGEDGYAPYDGSLFEDTQILRLLAAQAAPTDEIERIRGEMHALVERFQPAGLWELAHAMGAGFGETANDLTRFGAWEDAEQCLRIAAMAQEWEACLGQRARKEIE